MNVLVTSHGSFCRGLLDGYEMIAGTNARIFTLALTDKGIEVYTKGLGLLVEKLTKEGLLIIMVDMKEGTPFSESYKLALTKPRRIQIMTGANLPMLLAIGLSLNSDLSIDELVARGIEAAELAIEKVTGEHGGQLAEAIEF